MLAQFGGRAGARMAAVVVATVFCAGATLARAPSQNPALDAGFRVPGPAFEPPTAPYPLMAVERTDLPLLLQPSLPLTRSPFGLAASDTGSYSARWRLLQPSIAVERQVLASCRANPATCPAAAAKFSAIIETGRARAGLARIGEVNRAVNLAIRPVSDQAQYGVPDLWASPLMTFGSGAGDCEDYAIAKYVALREAGVAAEDLRLVVVDNRPVHEKHMVAAARVDGRWLILDNRTMRLAADDEITDLVPLAVLDDAEPHPAIAAAPAAQPAEHSAGNDSGLAAAL
jgi:predicted transglutaminase-like cysteine proteinase